MATGDSDADGRSIDITDTLTAERVGDRTLAVSKGSAEVTLSLLEAEGLRHALEDLDPEHEHSKRVLALGPGGWGKGHHETEALANAAPHLRHGGDPAEVTLVTVRGYRGHQALPHGVSVDAAEEVRTEKVRVDPDHLRRLEGLSNDIEIAAEEALVEAEEVETDGDD